MKATKEDALRDIHNGEYEIHFPAKRWHKRRICIFCGKRIPPGEMYYSHFEYPHMPDQKRWFACEECFNFALWMDIASHICQKRWFACEECFNERWRVKSRRIVR